MNKVTKGTLAAAAAGALLLGGAGTYAVWSDDETLNAGNVSTGMLTLNLEGGAWKQGETSIPVIDDFRMVPGDTLTYTTTARITAEGNNLSGTFAVTDNIAATAGAEDVSQFVTVALEPIDYSTVAGLSEDPVTKAVTFAEAGTYLVPMEVTVTLNAELEQAQGLEVDLGEVGLLLKQS